MKKLLYILGELEDSDLQWFLDSGSTRSVASGEEIIAEGHSVADLFIVVDGELAVRAHGSEIARLGTGEVIGEMSLINEGPATATVEASRAATVHAIPQVVLRAKLGSDPKFAARFYRALCVFLADRLSRAILSGSSEADSDENEITPDALRSASLAGARFNWFVRHIKRP